MSNKVILSIVGVVVVVGAAIFALLSGNTGSQEQTAGLNDQAMTGEESGDKMSESKSSTLRQLMLQGKSLECDFENVDEFGTQSGTVYLDGERMRGDFTMSQADFGAFTTHTIRDGKFGYAWGGPLGEKNGTKFELAAVESGDEEKGESIDLDEDIEFDCRSWLVDNSMFQPPADVNFDEITQEIKQIQEATGQLNEVQCAACDQVPAGPSRDQCLQALGC